MLKIDKSQYILQSETSTKNQDFYCRASWVADLNTQGTN